MKEKTHSEEWVLDQTNSNWLGQREIRMSDGYQLRSLLAQIYFRC